jgi:hypothetical protein
MKNRCVFVKEAGRRVDKENVAWYDMSFNSLVDSYFNTGDMTVYDSTLKLLDYRRSCRINTDLPVDFDLAKQVHDMFEVVVLRASNYIHEGMEWGHFAAWLEALDLPVLCLGVGAQASEKRRIVLPESGRRVWSIISDRVSSIGVRGAFTAGVLEENGIKNSEIVGCPSIFRNRSPDIKLRHKPVQDILRVAFSLRRETGDNYTRDSDEFLSLQRKWIFRLNKHFSLSVTAHGEVEEKAYYYNAFERKLVARDELRRTGWFDAKSGGEMETIYESQLFFTPVVSHYDEFVRSVDATIGYRVHGVLPALAAGTPSVLLRYDARSAELAETLSVPIFDPAEAIKQSFSDIFGKHHFSKFERMYPINYMNMKAFLEKNDIATRM